MQRQTLRMEARREARRPYLTRPRTTLRAWARPSRLPVPLPRPPAIRLPVARVSKSCLLHRRAQKKTPQRARPDRTLPGSWNRRSPRSSRSPRACRLWRATRHRAWSVARRWRRTPRAFSTTRGASRTGAASRGMRSVTTATTIRPPKTATTSLRCSRNSRRCTPRCFARRRRRRGIQNTPPPRDACAGSCFCSSAKARRWTRAADSKARTRSFRT
mmetsp:Transcript_5151/g.19273  ORF Transcript_5151/g.19273 Transcript_5151/m.19273 type:complete len:216 (-) Transcript_5151:4415-5062(-)